MPPKTKKNKPIVLPDVLELEAYIVNEIQEPIIIKKKVVKKKSITLSPVEPR